MNKLFSYLPKMYKDAIHVKNILNAVEAEVDKEKVKQADVIKDTSPSTTVHPELWEEEYGIAPASTIEGRRKNIIAKMRGRGATQAGKIKDIVEAYTSGDIEVTEDADDSMVHISIDSADATMSDIELMEAAVYEALPAHLDFRYNYSRPLEGSTHVAGTLQSTPVYYIGG